MLNNYCDVKEMARRMHFKLVTFTLLLKCCHYFKPTLPYHKISPYAFRDTIID